VTRREAVKVIGIGAAGLALPTGSPCAQTESESLAMLMRTIPSSGEKLPVIGLGTWEAFDVELTPDKEKQLGDVISFLAKTGRRVIDSSPMYGRSEQVIGTLAKKLGLTDKLFLATKVWTKGKQAGIEEMERSFARLQTKRIDLMQVHNLLDWRTQLATLREWKARGRIRYIGITHYTSGAFADVEAVMRSEILDFVQINYAADDRTAEERLLPLARERGIGVIVNQPFGGGGLLGKLKGQPVPEWSKEIGCTSWAQLLLKFVLAHPAVTCVIPGTGRPEYMRDNVHAGFGSYPDQSMRQRIAAAVI
jgi:aryl-alcohol dehydrogenase-like predicted oxidoreductase